MIFVTAELNRIFHFGKASATVVLGTSTTLLVTEILASTWSEKP